ncbi:esterase/lipase family protein [Candidatus Margulisiibacteriota bacterium]
MRKTFLILLLLLIYGSTVNAAVPYPVILIHGTGDSSVVWKTTGPAISEHLDDYYKTSAHPYFLAGSGIANDRYDKDSSDNPRNSCVYLVFSDHFADPSDLASEIKKVIRDTRDEVWTNHKDLFASKEDIKVTLICHSMGGLVARKYLVDNYNDHHVAELILLGVPNKGSSALYLDWVPRTLVVSGFGGALLASNPIFLGISLAGIGVDTVARSQGIKLVSPASESMKPGSKFLTGLNSRKMPEDVAYTVLLFNAEDLPRVTLNRIFGHEKGDGGVTFDSQSLKYAGVPNFNSLTYREIQLAGPHPDEPIVAKDAIIDLLGLRD